MGRTPNPKLDSFIHAARFSRAGLAHRVNAAGEPLGLNLTYGKQATSKWVAGHVPDAPVRRIVLALLSSKLGRPVTASDVGWPATAEAPDVLTTYLEVTDVCAVLPAIWSAAMIDRRGVLAGSAALPLPAVLSDYLTARPDPSLSHRGGRRVGADDVRMIKDLSASIRGLDHRYGGGRMASATAAMLSDFAAPLLRGTYSDTTGRQLWSAVGELTSLAGWAAFDSGADEMAHTHFLSALRLARGSGDGQLVGYVLTRMSHQTLWHRRGRDAVRYSQAAIDAAGDRLTARMHTHYLLIQARGHAMCGDLASLRQSAGEAQARFERGRSQDDPQWLGSLDYSELHGALAGAYAEADQGRVGLPHIDIALSKRDTATYARPHTLACLTRAELALSAGDADLADTSVVQAASLATPQGSARLPERFNTFVGKFSDKIGGARARNLSRRVGEALQTL